MRIEKPTENFRRNREGSEALKLFICEGDVSAQSSKELQAGAT